MTSGLLEEISVIVITSNLEFNSTCRMKNHSQSRWNTLLWPGLRTQIWTCLKKAVLTTVGMSMRIEVCQIHGQDSRSSLYGAKNFPKDTCGPESAWQRSKQSPDQIMCGLKHGLACQKQLRKKSINGPSKKTKAWWCSKAERQLLHRSGEWRVRWYHKKNAGKSWRYRWRRRCFVKWERRSVLTSRGKPQTKPNNPTTSKRQSVHASWKLMNPREGVWSQRYREIMRSHLGERVHFSDSLQLGAQVNFDAPSDVNFGCETRSRQGMEEARNIAILAIG